MDLYEELFFSLKYVHEEVISLMDTEEDPLLTKGQIILLVQIERKERMKTADISQHFGITAGAATAVADKLERLELVTRKRCVNDRRVVYIHLTKKGREFVLRRREIFKQRFKEKLGKFPEAEMTATIDALKRITEALQNKGEKR